jgi:transcriptional regulator with XRE-family HTH domain
VLAAGVDELTQASESVHLQLRELIKRRRLALGLSQATVAQRAGLARKAISFLEDGERMPKLDTFLRVAQALDFRLSDYLRQSGG